MNPRMLLRVAITVSLFCGGVVFAQTKSESKPLAQKDYKSLIYSVRGPDLFRAHCAPCHGADGKGGGSVAAGLKNKPANLTTLAKNNGGKFPEERVLRFISGDEAVVSHGSREMPIWGPIFHQIEEDQDYGNVRLQNLVKYLKSIQEK